jgi:hypothetical protein
MVSFTDSMIPLSTDGGSCGETIGVAVSVEVASDDVEVANSTCEEVLS